MGRTYEVYVDAIPVKLVGSTTKPLERRRIAGYVRRFGPSVELKLIREIPRPEGYTDRDYDFRLKAAEAFDIAAKKTYAEYGGLNKISPLIQALGNSILEAEIGRIGGKATKESTNGRKNGKQAAGKPKRCMDRARKVQISRENALKMVKNGKWAEICKLLTPEKRRETGLKVAARGDLDRYRPKACCQKFHINKNKRCVCGEHIFAYG